MKPVVLAWALLFVVAVGVLYRFGSWIGRRRRRSPRHSTKAEESDETPPDPKSTEDTRRRCVRVLRRRPLLRRDRRRRTSLLRRRASQLRPKFVSQPRRAAAAAKPPIPRRLRGRPTSGPLPITLPPRLQRYCGRASARRCSRPSPPSRLLEAGRLRCHRGLERRQLQRSRRVPKLRKFGQTFRRQCRPVRSRVRLQRTSRRPQSPNRHSTHRKQTCSKRVYLRASHAARVRHEPKFCPHLPNIGALRFAPAKLAQEHRLSACE